MAERIIIDARGSFCPGPLMELIARLKFGQVGEEFEVPYWMRDAITDYVTMRAAQKLMRLDRQFMTGIFRDMKYEMERGSWLTAMGYAKRMDRKQRRDTAIYLETFAPSS